MTLEYCVGLIFLSVILFSIGINLVLCEKSKFLKALGIILLSISIITVTILLIFFMHHIPGTLPASPY